MILWCFISVLFLITLGECVYFLFIFVIVSIVLGFRHHISINRLALCLLFLTSVSDI